MNKPFLTWLARVLLGPLCPYGCGYRGRGPRTLDAHLYVDHAGDPTTLGRR